MQASAAWTRAASSESGSVRQNFRLIEFVDGKFSSVWRSKLIEAASGFGWRAQRDAIHLIHSERATAGRDVLLAEASSLAPSCLLARLLVSLGGGRCECAAPGRLALR